MEAVAKKFAGRGNFELKSSKEVHDRHVFVDGRGWMMGQSTKDAAKKKPTYMVEIGASAVATIQAIYEGIWARALSVVKAWSISITPRRASHASVLRMGSVLRHDFNPFAPEMLLSHVFPGANSSTHPVYPEPRPHIFSPLGKVPTGSERAIPQHPNHL